MATLRIAARERAWVVLAAVVITEVSLAIGRQSIGPLAPFLQQDLGISRAQVGLFVSAIYLGGIVAVTPSGWLADSLSIRYLLLAGQGIVGAFVIATTTTASFPPALLLLFVTGIGYGITAPATAKAVMKWFTPTTRGTAMSIKQTGVTFGGAMSGALLPVLALAAGWRVAFALAGAAIVAAGLAAFALYHEHPLGDGAASAVVKAPLRTVLFNRNLLLVSAMAAVWAAIQVSFATYIVLFLTESLGMAVVAAGGLLAMAQMSGTAGRLVSGIASDRLCGGRRKVVLLLFGGLMVGSALGAAALRPGVAAWALGALVIVFGLAVYGWAGVQMALVGELAGKERAGTAIGLSLAVSFGGVMVGPPLFGYIVDATHSYPTAWYSLAVAGVVGMALLLLAREGHRGE